MKILALEFSSERRSAAVWTDAGFGGRAEESGGRSVAAFRMIEEALRAARVEREQIDTLAVGRGPGSYNGVRVAMAIAQGWQLAANVKLLGISSAECLAAQAHAGGFITTPPDAAHDASERTPSPPSEGGEGRGEEGRRTQTPPLSPTLSPLVPHGEREKIVMPPVADRLTGVVHTVMDAQRGDLYLASYEITTTGWRETEPLRIVSVAEAQARVKSGGTVIGPEATRWFPEARVMFPDATMLAQLAAKRTDFIPGEQLEPIYLREVSFVKAPPPRVISGI